MQFCRTHFGAGAACTDGAARSLTCRQQVEVVPRTSHELELLLWHPGAVREDQAALGSAFEDQLHLLGHVRSSGMVGKSGVRVGDQSGLRFITRPTRTSLVGRSWPASHPQCESGPRGVNNMSQAEGDEPRPAQQRRPQQRSRCAGRDQAASTSFPALRARGCRCCAPGEVSDEPCREEHVEPRRVF